MTCGVLQCAVAVAVAVAIAVAVADAVAVAVTLQETSIYEKTPLKRHMTHDMWFVAVAVAVAIAVAVAVAVAGAVAASLQETIYEKRLLKRPITRGLFSYVLVSFLSLSHTLRTLTHVRRNLRL